MRRRDPFATRGVRSIPQKGAEAIAPTKPELRGCVIALPGKSGLRTLSVTRAARLIAGDGVVLAISDERPEMLASHGIDFVASADSASIPAYWNALQPQAVVMPDDEGHYADVGRRLAVELGLSIAVRVVEIVGSMVRSDTNLPGKEMIVSLPQVVLVDDRLSAPAVGARPCRAVELPLVDADVPLSPRRIGTIDPEPDTLPLQEAPFVVAAGAGIADIGLFRKFVAALGATPGASRVLVDAGLMPRDRQVGASGHSTSADVYVAMGISGAVQHMEGIADCRHVIAVNTDASCTMARQAGLTLVTDAELFMRAVLERLGAAQ